MKKIIEGFIKYGIYSNIVIAVTIILGIVTLVNTRKSFFPERESRDISITVAYPGASPVEVEEGITQRIEEAIENIPGIDEMRSTSSENSVSIRIETLSNFELDEVFTEVKNAVDAINSFPASAEKPIIFKVKRRSVTQWLGLNGDVDLKTLKKYAEQIEDDLLALPNISQVVVSGFPRTEISIEIKEDQLLRYGLTFDDIVRAVRSNNLDLSGGSLKTSSEEVLIRSRAKKEEVDKIGEIILKANNDGSKILLRDVTSIREQFEEVPSASTLDGKQAVFLRVDKLSTEDIAKISEDVKTYVEDFNARNDIMQLYITFNFYDLLLQRLEMLLGNFGLGMILVVVCLGLFLSLRLSFWVAWGIPASFLGMFIMASFVSGFTINMISLFGMILVVGILVDDGIVIAENIYSHFERGKNPYRAAIDGTLEVFPAVTASVTTTIIAFLPILVADGLFDFLVEMAIVIIFSLAFSLLEAFLVLPAHLGTPNVLSRKTGHIERSQKRNKSIRQFLDGVIAYLRDKVYGRALTFTMTYKWISLSFLAGLILIVIGLMQGGFIKSTFFPKIQFSSLNIDLSFKPGTRETVVQSYIKRFDSLVWQTNQDLKIKYEDENDIIKHTFGRVGSNGLGDNGSHAGSMTVFYRELDDGPISSYQLKNMIKRKIGELPEAERFVIGGNSRWGKPVALRLISKNNEHLATATMLLKNELSKLEDLTEINDDIKVGKRELQIDLNEQAYFLGFSHNDIARQLRQGFFGEEVQRLQKGSDEVRVWVRYPNSNKKNFGQLENLKIKDNQTQTDKKYQLSELVNYNISRGVSSIKHFNGSRTVTVEAEMADPDRPVPPIIEIIKNDIIPLITSRFPDVKLELGGQAESSGKTANNMAIYFGGAFFTIFIVIMITFRSFYQAVLILMMIPLGWLGAVIGHGIEGNPVSILSAWGMVALSGVIINDAVVFLDKYNRSLREGFKVPQAAYIAGISRFRPILLTSLTTVCGLYPLIRETSFQAQFLVPMGISIAYGVFIGTFIILLFFPVFIVLFNDVRIYSKWLWIGKKPLPEEVERAVIDVDKDLLISEKVDSELVLKG